MIKDKDEAEWIKVFEQLGESKVETNLLSGRWGNPDDHSYPKAIVAKIWLERKKSQKEGLIKNKELELVENSNKIANSAKNASWWVLGLSIISILVSIIAILIKK